MGALRERLGGNTRFRLVRKLGEGGMGTVYEAEDDERGELVAIKTLVHHDPMALLRFKNEFRGLQDLEHPNLVRLGELHEAGGDWFFTMELVPGTDLLSYVQGEVPRASTPPSAANDTWPSPVLPYDEVRLRACFQQLAVGLHALHMAGKIHRDIKPSNVRVTPEGRVVILDFGLVVDQGSARLSTQGNVLGTVAYMAPEQATSGDIDASADWYAFGVVLYEALTGDLPFAGPNLQVMLDKLSSTPPHPRARFAKIPADLDELCVELLRASASARPCGEELPRRLGFTTEQAPTPTAQTTSMHGDGGPFVGRDGEFAALEAAFAEACSGNTLTLSIEGPSGIGKSALVTRFVQRISSHTNDVMVLQGRCYERETARFKALDGIIDALANALTRLPGVERHQCVPRNAALLRQLFPVLGRVDVIARAPRPKAAPSDPTEERRLMFMSLRELLARLGDRKQLLLVIDDMHWSDADSLELLRALLDPSQGPPPRLILLVTSRAPWLPADVYGNALQAWPVELRRLHLEPLAEDDALKLARSILQRNGVNTADAEQIVRESRGHPLFVAELARHAGVSAGAGDAPLTLDAAIWARARNLPEPGMRALMLLAVAAVPLSVRLLELATHLTPSAFERHLSVLRISGFVRSATGRDKRRVEPYHDRVREAVLDQLDAAQRAELHATLAPLLEQEPGIDPEHVAQHYLDAGQTDKASVLFERAACNAEKGFAFERAALLYRMQLEVRTMNGAERSATYQKIGAALARAGQARAAADAYAHAIEGSDDVSSVRLRYLSASHLLRSGHINEGLAQCEQVLESVGLYAPKSRISAIAAFLWERLRLRFSGYRAKFREESLIAPAMLAQTDALISVGQGLAWFDGIRAAPLFARALRSALATGERGRITRTLCGEALLLAMQGHRQAARVAKVMSYARASAETLNDPQILVTLRLTECSIASNLCDFPASLQKANEALAILDTPGIEAQWERASGRIYRILNLEWLGHWREANSEVSDAMADAENRRDRLLLSYLRLSASNTHARIGALDVASARARLEEGYAPWRDREPGFFYMFCLLNSLVIDLYDGRGDQALARLRSQHSTLRNAGVGHMDMMRRYFAFLTGTAQLMLTKQRADDAALEKVLACARVVDSNCAWYGGLAAMLRAQVAIARQRPEQALELARAAERHYEAASTTIYASCARWLHGSILGGETGRTLCNAAHAHLSEQGATRPEVHMQAYAPYAIR